MRGTNYCLERFALIPGPFILFVNSDKFITDGEAFADDYLYIIPPIMILLISAPDFASKLSKGLTVSLKILSVAILLVYYLVTVLLDLFAHQGCLLIKLVR